MDAVQGKVLIVEDDTALRRSLRSALCMIGFDIGEAGNGEEAIMRLRMVDYDAVLLDINMPGMGGMDTCSRMRRLFTRIPILTLTVQDSEDDKVSIEAVTPLKSVSSGSSQVRRRPKTRAMYPPSGLTQRVTTARKQRY
jgi:CheY-like chemotaxis protein